MTTAIYVRISRDSQQTGLGVERQRKACDKLCADNGWAPTVVYEDNDLSAYSGRRRPAYQRMLDAVAAGVVDRVVAWHPDRLHRSPRELEDFIDLIDATGSSVVTVMAGLYDLTTSAGRTTARIIGAVARGESEQKSERIRAKHLELASNGALSGGGSRPYGYDRGVGENGKVFLEVNDSEAAIIREVMARYLSGESLVSLVRELNARDVPTAAGGVWRVGTLRGILLSGLISGQREHHGEIAAVGDWPAIVSSDDTERAHIIATANTARATRIRTTHELSGLVRCGRCAGGRMYAGEVIGGVPKLRCGRPPNGCGKTVIVRQPLIDLVVEAVLQAVDTGALAEISNSTTKSVRQAFAEVRDAEKQLAELAAAYADKVVSMGEWRVARDRIQQRVVEARSLVAGGVVVDSAIAPYRGKGGMLRAAWPEMVMSQRNALLKAVVETVTIAPAVKGRKAFDPGRVTLQWRG